MATDTFLIKSYVMIIDVLNISLNSLVAEISNSYCDGPTQLAVECPSCGV